MADQFAGATGGDNARDGHDDIAGTAAAGQNAGDGSSDTSADKKQADGRSFSQDELNAIVQKRLEKAQKEWERKLKDAEDKAKLSEDERTKAELAEMRSQLAERDRRDTVAEAAKTAGIKNPKLFYSAYKSELETDANGVVTNLKEILESAKSEAPELFGVKPAGSADGGEGTDAAASGLYSKQQLEKLSEPEINANWEKVQRSLAALNK